MTMCFRVWLFDAILFLTLFPSVGWVPHDVFLTFPCFFWSISHISSPFPLSSATKTQDRRECGLVQNHRQIFMSLCWWQQLCSVSSEAVPLKLPLCSGFVWELLSFHLVLRAQTSLTVICHHDKELIPNIGYVFLFFEGHLCKSTEIYGISKKGWFLPKPTQNQSVG